MYVAYINIPPLYPDLIETLFFVLVVPGASLHLLHHVAPFTRLQKTFTGEIN